jgi:hypothetical protein
VNTDTITRAVDLPDKPFTREDADAMVRAHAIKAQSDGTPGTRDQYARMLAVALWHEVDPSLFSEIVEDMAKRDEIEGGADLDRLFGPVDPDDPLDESSDDVKRRATWVEYYDDAIKFSIRHLLDNAGY